jgi:CheY-like chemotaxis protein
MARILIADDQASVRSLIRSILEAAGHKVVEARNGQEAIRLSSEEDDLVVTDVLMPEKDGLEVVRHIKQQKRKSPVLVVTSGWTNSEVDLLKVATTLGADRVLAKAKVRGELLAVVTEMLVPGSARSEELHLSRT